MADNTEKKVLINVDVQAKEALKAYASLKIEVDKLKASQKELDTSTEEGRLEFEAIGQQIKALNKEAQVYQKEIQTNIKYQNEKEGSLQKLRAELSLNTAAQSRLSEEERNSVKGSMLADRISETTAKLKEEEAALGNHRREVGNYAIASQGLSKELTALINNLQELKLAGQENTAEYQEGIAKAAELKNAIEGVNKATSAASSDTAQLDGITQSLTVATSAYAAYTAVIASNMEVSEEYLEVMKNMQVALTALGVVTTVQNSLTQKSIAYTTAENLLKKIGVDRTKAATAAEAAFNVVKGQGTIASKAIAAATWLWNKALSANPVLLIVTGIILLVTAVTKLTNAFSASAKAEREAKKASEEYENQVRRTSAAIEGINNQQTNAINDRKNKLREEILELKKNGATEEQIAAAKRKADQDLRDIQIKYSEERIEQLDREAEEAKENYDAQGKVLLEYRKKYGEQSEKYKEQKKLVDDLYLSIARLGQSRIDEVQAQKELNLEGQESEQQKVDDEKKKGQERAKNYQEQALKLLDMQRNIQQEQEALREVSMSSDFLAQQQWEKKKFDSAQAYEMDKLDMQKKFNKITEKEYQLQYSILATQQEAFNRAQLKGLNEYYAAQREELFSLIDESVDAQIKRVEKKYADAAKSFDMPTPVRLEGQSDEDFKKEMDRYKEFMFEKAMYEKDLERQKQIEINEIRANSLEKRAADIEKIINNEYKSDLAQYSDNERRKTEITIEQLQKQIEAKKAAGLETYEDEAALRAAQNQQIQLNLNADLLRANQNATLKYEATKKALEAEQKLYEGNADKQLEIAQKLADNEKTLLEARIEKFTEWAGLTMDIASSFSDYMSAREEAELQRYEEDNERKKASLQSRLDAGLISQEEYDDAVAAADKELDSKKKEIERAQAEREKALKVFDIGINTAAAIMKNTAQLGLLTAIPVNIATAALGAVQLAAVLAAPLPKASRGLLLNGPSHANGGIPIEAEGGEAIINKRSTAMFTPLLSAINMAGGGVPFVSTRSDGGYTARSIQQNIDMKEFGKMLTKSVVQGVEKLKVYTAIRDLNDAQDDFVKMEDRSGS